MLYHAADMHRRRIHRWAAIAVLALLTLEGLGIFESGHDDCADGHRHDACVCMCACHTYAEPAADIEIAAPTALARVVALPALSAGILVPPEIFRPPLA